MDKSFLQGYQSFKPYLDVFDCNPYKRIDDLKDGIKAYQPEATFFYNGWEAAKRDLNDNKDISIFLDDFRFPNWINYIKYPENISWVVIRHYHGFVDFIKENGMPKLISWDFDLDQHKEFQYDAATYKNGLDCTEWLIQYCKKYKLEFPQSVVHSQNINEGPKIVSRIQEYLNNKN